MRIGLVVDPACDLPLEYLQKNDITLLPITVRIGDAVLADHPSTLLRTGSGRMRARDA